MPHSQQMNDVLADQLIAHYTGKPAVKPWTAPVPWVLIDKGGRRHQGSENHRAEGKVVGYAQSKPNTTQGKLAQSELLNHLRDQQAQAQRRYGLQGAEFNTNSHFPHWCRYGAMGLKIAYDRDDSEVVVEFLTWWSCQLWMMVQLCVPRGPKKDSVIGWGARYRKGGDSDERDVVFALLDGRPSGKSPGYFERALTRRDSFGVRVMKEMVESGVLKEVEPVKPASQYDLNIVHHEDGHVCTCSNPTGKDPSVVWVRYTDGEVGTGGELPDLGKELSVVKVGPR